MLRTSLWLTLAIVALGDDAAASGGRRSSTPSSSGASPASSASSSSHGARKPRPRRSRRAKKKAAARAAPRYSRPDRATRKLSKVRIPMPDGRKLSAQIWLPRDAEERGRQVPAILDYTPYGLGDGYHPWFAKRGYASIQVEVTGTGESEGINTDEYTRQEQEDALHVLEWIASQPWSTGKVGMMGISYQGFNSLQVAAMRPKQLAGILVAHASENRYTDDAHYRGGALLTENSLWGTYFFQGLAAPPDYDPGYQKRWLKRLDSLEPVVSRWLGTPDTTGVNYLDATKSGANYWATPSDNLHAIEVPVYAMGGWADGYVNTVMRVVGGTAGKSKGLIGPWSHGSPDHALPGPRVAYLDEALRFWDHTLKGYDNGVLDEPVLKAWMQESVTPDGQHHHRPGRWTEEPSWPRSRAIRTTSLHLGDGGTLGRGRPARNRRWQVRSPQSLGSAAGKWAGFGAREHFPGDQQHDDARSLVFDMPVEERTEILGGPRMKLRLSAEQISGNVIVRLNDVHPDGRSTRVTYGVLNLTHREGHDKPKPLERGRLYDVEVVLNDVAYAFPKGHTMRVAISNAYWPMIWPDGRNGALTIESSGSRLELPVRRIDPRERPASPPEANPQKGAEEWGGNHEWVDHETGEHVARIGDQEFRIKDGDPRTASMRVTTESGRDEGWVRVETHQTADRTHFRVRTRLQAFVRNEKIFERSWDQKIRRAP